MLVLRAQDRTFPESPLPNIKNQPAWTGADGSGGYFTRLAAGARFPSHRHEGWEQILVLSGKIAFGDATLTKGDLLLVDANDVHDANAIEDTEIFVAHYRGIQFVE